MIARCARAWHDLRQSMPAGLPAPAACAALPSIKPAPAHRSHNADLDQARDDARSFVDECASAPVVPVNPPWRRRA